MRRGFRTTLAVGLGVISLAVASSLPSYLRRSFDRAVVVFAVVCATFMIGGALGPWVGYRSGGSWSGLERADEVAIRGWIVLVAGLAAGALAVFAARTTMGTALVLVAGVFASAAAFDARDAAGSACPDLGSGGGGGQILGLFCMPRSVGWGLHLATVGSLGLSVAGAVLLSAATSPRLPQRPLDRSFRDMAKKYAR